MRSGAFAWIVGLALGASWACGESGGPSSGGSIGGDSVIVSSNAFTPTLVHPDSAGVVRWIWNSGGVTHNITFESAITGSGDQASGTFQQSFTVPGAYRFRCTIHSTSFSNGMHGEVFVGGGGGGYPDTGGYGGYTRWN